MDGMGKTVTAKIRTSLQQKICRVCFLTSENWFCFHKCFGEKTASVIFLDFYSIYLIFLSIYKILFDVSNKTVDIL